MSLRAVARLLAAKEARLPGDVSVFRALPRREQRRVGPFVFLDHGGPGRAAEHLIPAHPHVGLQTVTYLLSGEVEHSDSLGFVQRIRPGDVNWMTAGRGIVHAERVLATESLHLVQTWVALPHGRRDVAPAFEHFPGTALPVVERGAARVRVLAGRLGEAVSPVPAHAPITYLDVDLPGGEATLRLDPEHELALYVPLGAVRVGDVMLEPHALAALGPGEALRLESAGPVRVLVLGGAPMPEPTAIWWNFVTDTVEEGRRLQQEWDAGRFPGADWRPPVPPPAGAPGA